MKYVERELGPVEIDPDAQMKERFSRLPGFVASLLVRMNLKKIRDGMGGESRDITRLPIRVEDRMIEGHREEIRIRVYSPGRHTTLPLLMFHHGGGWFGGSVEAVEDFCKGVADWGHCVVISVDYHLAPEHKYPTAIEDSYKALLWAVAHADELGIDPKRVSVGGDSAGGNIAAVLTAMANDRKDLWIHRQILIYPAIDNTLEGLKENFPTTYRPFQAVMKMYVGNKRLLNDPYVSPNTYRFPRSLPGALIAVGELDDLRSTTLDYAKALDHAGVDVEFILYKNANHAFIDNTGNNPNADDLVLETSRFINQ